MIKRSFLLILVAIPFFNSSLSCRQISEGIAIEFSERFRFVSWDNAVSLADSAHAARTYTRHRTSIKGQWLPSSNIEVGLKLTNEFRHYFVPESLKFNFNELFVDQFYIKLTNPFEYPIALTIGRQNIMLGEGFIVMDGNPLDGSRSIYFNAVKLAWTIKPKHKITAFYSYQTETDDWLPLIHNQEQNLVEQPEEGIGIYYTGELDKSEIHVYYIRKNVDSNRVMSVQSDINSIGARLIHPILSDLDCVVESAHQFGKRNDSNRSAWGGYMYLDFRPAWNKHHVYLPYSLALGVIYLSGDDPQTGQWEGWDPMFARWPKWSESYIHTQIKENRVAYWTNMISLYAKVKFKFTANADLCIDYHHLMAPQEPSDESAFPGGQGKTRGDLFIGKLTYKFNKCWSGHILWEGFVPGNYYFDSADSYNWLRTELTFRF